MSGLIVGEWSGGGSDMGSARLYLHQDQCPLGQRCCGMLSVDYEW